MDKELQRKLEKEGKKKRKTNDWNEEYIWGL
jgi:hypothetical protein